MNDFKDFIKDYIWVSILVLTLAAFLEYGYIFFQ